MNKEEQNIMLKALKYYEDRFYNIITDSEQETINKLKNGLGVQK